MTNTQRIQALGAKINTKSNAGVALTNHETAILWWLDRTPQQVQEILQSERITDIEGLTDNDLYRFWNARVK